MTTSRQHQEAHGIGQIEDQLERRRKAAEAIQGVNGTDADVAEASRRRDTELDEIIET